MDLIKRFDERAQELQPLYDRMDKDMALWLLSKYTFTKADGKTKPKDAENVTTNDPRVFADFVISILAATDRKYIISNANIDDNNKAENFIKYAVARAEEKLAIQGEAGLDYSIDWNSCLRGTPALIAILKTNGKLWDFDIQPVDGRTIVWETGRQGCLYGGTRVELTKDIIERDYDHIITDEAAKVKDIWTKDEHVVAVNDKKILTVKHKLMCNPFIVVPVSTSPRFVYQTNTLEHMYESIFAGARDLYALLNRHMSAFATANVRSTFRPVVFKSDRYDELEQPPTLSDAVSKIGTDESLDLFPIADFNAAYQAFIGHILQQLQRGTVSNVSMGELGLHGLSALVLKQLDKAKDRIFVPRVRAKNMLFTILGYNLIKQFINGGYYQDLDDGIGEELLFDPKDFIDKKFVIKVEHYTEKPEESMASMTLAANARAIGMPEKYVMENILKVDNYRDVEYQGLKEKAIARTPMLENLYEARALIEVGDEYDIAAATILLREIGMEMRGKKIVPINEVRGKQTAAQQPKPSYDLSKSQAIEQQMRSDDAAMVNEEAEVEMQSVSGNQRRM